MVLFLVCTVQELVFDTALNSMPSSTPREVCLGVCLGWLKAERRPSSEDRLQNCSPCFECGV